MSDDACGQHPAGPAGDELRATGCERSAAGALPQPPQVDRRRRRPVAACRRSFACPLRMSSAREPATVNLPLSPSAQGEQSSIEDPRGSTISAPAIGVPAVSCQTKRRRCLVGAGLRKRTPRLVRTTSAPCESRRSAVPGREGTDATSSAPGRCDQGQERGLPTAAIAGAATARPTATNAIRLRGARDRAADARGLTASQSRSTSCSRHSSRAALTSPLRSLLIDSPRSVVG